MREHEWGYRNAVRNGVRSPQACCMEKGIHVYNWNMGGPSWEAFEEWVDILSQEAEWDMLLLQETFRNVDARHLQVPQGWDVLNALGGGRAAPAIVLNRKLSGYLVDSVYGETFVGAAFGLTPPLIALSWHSPNAGMSEDEEMVFQGARG